MPVFSPSAAKPSARLQEVVDLPTPPLPEATAMTYLTPGMPAALEVARALRSGVTATGGSRSKRIALLHIARAQIIFRRHDRWSLRRRMRIEALVHHSFDAAIRAHLDDVETPGVGALEHPVLLAELGKHAVDRALGAERLTASDAIERLFFLQHAERRIPRREVEARFDADDFFGAGGLAKAALHAEALGKAQHRTVGIVRQRARRTGGDAGMAKRAAFDIQLHAAEGRARRQRYDIDGGGRGEVKLAKGRLEHAAFR